MTFLSEAVRIGVGYAPERRQVRWHRALGEAYLGLGELGRSREHTYQALRLLGHPVRSTKLGLLADTLRQFAVQAAHRCLPFNYAAHSEADRELYLQAATASERVSQHAYLAQQPLLVLNATLRCVNFGERAGPGPQLPRSYAAAFAGASFIFPRAMSTYHKLIEKSSRDIEDLAARMWVAEVQGLFTFSQGNLKAGREHLAQAVELASEVGDWRRWEECTQILGEILYAEGRFEESGKLFTELLQVADRRDHEQGYFWGTSGIAMSALRLGRPSEARARLEPLVRRSSAHVYPTELICAQGLLALACWQVGDREKALAHAKETRRLVAGTHPVAHHAFEGYAGAAEVYLRLWHECASSSHGDIDHARRQAQEACRKMQRYARVLPIARPRAWFYKGLAHWLGGRHNKANRAWHKSISLAAHFGMPFEESQAHLELGRHLTAA